MGISEGRPWLPPVIAVGVGALLFIVKIWTWLPYPLLWNILVLLTGVFLILLVLIQRGKGGGLAGAFGGVGGSSPFGSKAGDQFTRFTIYTAAFWVLLIMLQVRVMNGAKPVDNASELPGVTKPTNG